MFMTQINKFVSNKLGLAQSNNQRPVDEKCPQVAKINPAMDQMFSFSRRDVNVGTSESANPKTPPTMVDAAIKKTRATGELAVRHMQTAGNSLNDLMQDLIGEQALFGVKVEA